MAVGPHYGSQTKARKAALDVIFAAEMRGADFIDMLEQRRTVEGGAVRELTETIVRGVAAHLAEIDARLEPLVSETWTLQRMPAVDRNLARIAVFEMDHTSTPGPAVIAEAVRLASDLSTDESPSYLNGLLAQALATKPEPTDN